MEIEVSVELSYVAKVMSSSLSSEADSAFFDGDVSSLLRKFQCGLELVGGGGGVGLGVGGNGTLKVKGTGG